MTCSFKGLVASWETFLPVHGWQSVLRHRKGMIYSSMLTVTRILRDRLLGIAGVRLAARKNSSLARNDNLGDFSSRALRLKPQGRLGEGSSSD